MKIYRLYRRERPYGPPGELLKETANHSEIVAATAAALRHGDDISTLQYMEEEIDGPEEVPTDEIWGYLF